MGDVKICNNKRITKLNQYFYMTPEGDVLKYKKYCIIHSCKNWLHLIIITKKYFYVVMNIN